jgi:hypothetical protein
MKIATCLASMTLSLLTWTSPAHALTYLNVSSLPVGPKMLPWTHLISFSSPTAFITWVDPFSATAGLEVTTTRVPSGWSHAFYLAGDVFQVHRLRAFEDGLPITVSFDAEALAGDIDVLAYDASNALVDSDTIVALSGRVSISLSFRGGIAYIDFEGGDQEDFVGDICFD